MGKNKFREKNTIDARMIDRIDSINMDTKYNPYEARKKQTVNDSELFNNELYLEEDDEGNLLTKEEAESSSNSIVPIVVTVVIILVVVVIGILIVPKLL